MAENKIIQLLEKTYKQLEEGDFENASKTVSSLKTLAPHDPRVCFVACDVHLAKEEGDLALEVVEEGLKVHPDNPVLLYQHANILLDEFEDVEAALAILVPLVDTFASEELDPEFMADVYILLSDTYEAQCEYASALAIAEKAFALLPQDPRVRLTLANALFDAGQIDAALKQAQAAVAKDDLPEDYFLLGRIYTFQQNPKAAKQAFEAAQQRAPELFDLPYELDEEPFLKLVNTALKEVPTVITDFVESMDVLLERVPSKELLRLEKDKLSPAAMSYLQISSAFKKGKDDPWDHPPEGIVFFMDNISVVCHDENDVAELIKSEIIHQISRYLEEE